ncbi:amino acid adenylation domain protein (plasmid) [Gemmatirosa kalamazoonensis]|uniref:Amino acid adenylation domain protein n=1 Tax=Gemmatirosa kalamazoonensis TaxID=861299 RepID=W0RVI6_9BACT|nr:non-ribosomal peptide synthetase [Gemmatirosa kalamazoonensis]AHG93598.1 amino acid adenylation domain protein [Gemmatirosa kalamazoonensis]
MTTPDGGGTSMTPALAARLAQLSPERRALVERQLQAARQARATTIPRRPDAARAPLSLGQEFLWSLHEALPELVAYHVPRVLRLRGPLDVAALRRALDGLVARHEALRTRFVRGAAGPEQVIDAPAPVALACADLTAGDDGALENLLGTFVRRPFDLARDPQLRALLVRLGADDHVLALVSHHLVCDEGSRDVVFGDLAALYAGESLPPLDVQYADYAVWQRAQHAAGALAPQLDFWRERLRGLTRLELPTDRPRAATPSFAGARHRFTLPAELAERVRALSRAHGATPFMTLLAAFQALLARYTGQDDVAVGTPVSARALPELQRVVGYFPNLVVLRTALHDDPTFAALVARVRDTSMQAFEHQDVPLDLVAAELGTGGAGALAQVSFQLATGEIAAPALHGVEASVVPTDFGSAKFELVLGLRETTRGYDGMIEYRTDLFDAPTIARMAEHFGVLLAGAVAEPERPVSRLPLLTAVERAQLAEWNDTARSLGSEDATLVSLLAEQAARTPDAVAVVDERASLTYAALEARAAALARRLRALGVGAGALVAVCAERSVELVVALVAVGKAGGAYVPVDPEYPAERVAYMLADSGAPVLLTTRALAGTLPAHQATLVLLDGAAEDADRADVADHADDVVPLPRPAADDVAYMIYTSGSTGRPKGALNAHRGIVNRLRWMQAEYALGAGDVVLQKTPFSFDVSVWEFFWPLMSGAKLVLARPGGHRDAAYLAATIQRHGVTVCHFVPSMLRAFLAEPTAAGCVSLRDVLASGEALAPDLVAGFYRALPGSRLHNLYGPTECAVDVTYWPCPPSPEPPAVVPIGRPVANTTLHVLDAHRQLVPLGVAGELYLGGVQVGMGYHGRPELTAERFVPDPFGTRDSGRGTRGGEAPESRVPSPGSRLYRTGDLARWRPDGTVEYLGRLDFQVKIRGFRIELGEIESALTGVPGIAQAVVVVRDDAVTGPQLVACVVAEPDAVVPDAEALRDTLGASLPPHMVPSQFVTLDALPLTPSGKADRKALVALLPEARAAREIVAPRTPTERRIAEMWADAFSLPAVSVDDGFLDLGGHSLLAMRVLGRIRHELGVHVPLDELLRGATVARVAALVDELSGVAADDDAHPLVPVACDGDTPVLPTSFQQQRFWILDQIDAESAAYTLPVALRLTGALDAAKLEHALNAVVARHEALRTVFALRDDAPAQVILPTLRVPLPVTDLRALAPEARDARVAAESSAHANAPFDLAAGPLVRAALLRTADDEHVLLLTLHHIVADGWSMGVLLDEIGRAYAGDALAPLGLQYADYAVWQRRALQSPAAARQLDYWGARLTGVAPLELPTDRPRPAVQTVAGAKRERHVPAAVAEGVRALARARGATPYATCLAAFAAVLHRYTGQADFAIGSITSGRRRTELEPIVGLFMNTLAVRVAVDAGAPFAALLAQVRDAAAEALAHQDVPFEQVVERVQPTRDRSRSPIFQVAFQLLDGLGGPPRIPGLDVAPARVAKETAKFELTLVVRSAPDGGFVTVAEYNTDLFDAATIDRLLAHYATLLEAASRDANVAVSRLPLLDAAERLTVLQRWNDTARPLPAWTVPARVLAVAAASPAAVAVRAEDETLTYAELARRSALVARRLESLGVRPGDRVGVCVERSASLVPALLGVLRAGAAYVPVDASYPAERIAHVLGDAGVRAVLTDAESAPRLPAVEAPIERIESVTWASGDPIDALAPCDVDAESLAYVLYTSGSTGRPKGVMIPHRALANFLASMAERPGLAAGDALVAVTTISFDIAGLELWLPLVTGAEVVLASRATAVDGAALRALVERTAARARGVMLQATPATWRLLLETGWSGTPTLTMLCGGEAWPPGLAESLVPRGAALWNVYGPTETTIWSTRAHVATPGPISLGEPLANTTLYVLEPTGEPAPLGVPGELWIGGAGLAHGYHGRPDLTAERFVPDPFAPATLHAPRSTLGPTDVEASVERGAWSAEAPRMYRTGDLVRRHVDGRLEYLGRLDDQVKVRGYRIELGEIESVLARTAGVAQAAVAARRAESGDAQLVGYVVLDDAAAADAVLGAARERLRAALPEYMVPNAVMVLGALPLTPNGKVDRRALPAPSAEAVAAAARPYTAPRSPLEAQIADAWAGALGVERVGVDDDFFALGGHSLLAMRVIARLADVVPVRLTIGALFEARTVADLAALVVRRLAEGGTAGAEARIPRRADQGPAPLSFAQELLWLHEQMAPGTAAYNVPLARRVRGPLDVARLEAALGALVARHEALRTTFVETSGGPRQVVDPSRPVGLELVDAADDAAAADALREIAARPFDLAAGPVFRVGLVRRAADDAVLLFVAHHAVFDGGSIVPLLRDLAAYYEGRGHELPPLDVHIADVAAWERARVDDERAAPALAFWREALRGAPAVIDLPFDHPRSASAGGPGARYAVTLPAVTRDAARALAARYGATPFAVLLTAFQSLLFRVSAQDDLVVGAPVSGRARRETEPLVGHLVNALALRARFDDDPTFAELLARTRDAALRALEHAALPYERLVRELRAGAPAAEATLFRVMFSVQDVHEAPERLGVATMEPLGVDVGASKFDLSLLMAERPDGLRAAVEYRRDLLDEATVARLVAQLGTLIEAAAAAPDERVSRLALATAAERAALLAWSARPAVQQLAPTVHGMFERWAQRCPDAVALRFGEQRLTYAQVERRANALAHRLRAAGVSRGTIVGLCVERSMEFPIGALAVMKAGGAYLPLDPDYPRERLAFMVQDSGAPVLLTQRALVGRVPEAGTLVFADDESLGAVDARLDGGAGAEDLAYVIYTSGSTGRPKGALLRHRGACNLASALGQELGVTPDERVLQFSALSFDASVLEILWSLCQGGCLHLVSKEVQTDPDALATMIAAEGITATLLPPVMLRAIDPSRVPALRTVLSGGEACGADIVERWAPGRRLFNAYGPTEVTVMPTMARLGDRVRGIPIGGPLPGCRTYVLDAAGAPVPVGVPGELFIGGLGVGAGYLNRPELTRERFVSDPFVGGGATMYRSGDRVRWRADRQLDYLGRLDQQVKLRGYRIELGEIESLLAAQPGVASAAVTVRRDVGDAEALVGYYCAAAGGDPGAAALLAALRGRLPTFMVPAALVRLDALPLTPSGKLDRAALPAPEVAAPAHELLEPRDDVEAVVAGVWREVLARDRVGIETSFFDLGGHSLLATRIAGQVSRIFRTSLPLRRFFEAPTVAGVARALAELEPKAGQTTTIARLFRRAQQMTPEERERLRREKSSTDPR